MNPERLLSLNVVAFTLSPKYDVGEFFFLIHSLSKAGFYQFTVFFLPQYDNQISKRRKKNQNKETLAKKLLFVTLICSYLVIIKVNRLLKCLFIILIFFCKKCLFISLIRLCIQWLLFLLLTRRRSLHLRVLNCCVSHDPSFLKIEKW